MSTLSATSISSKLISVCVISSDMEAVERSADDVAATIGGSGLDGVEVGS